MKKKRILVLCARDRDYRELRALKNEYDFIFHELNNLGLFYCLKNTSDFNDPIKIMEDIISEYKNEDLDAVISSSDYPGIIFAAILAKKLNLVAPEIESIMLCQHKYYCRLQQQKIIPDCVPSFHLLKNENKLGYPFFVKPVKSAFSIGAKVVKEPSDLLDVLSLNPLPKNFVTSFEKILKKYSSVQDPVNYLIAEEFVTGKQMTIEGFVFKGEVFFLGVIDANFYPDTLCFESFTYPSTLPINVQKKAKDVTQKFIKYINFDNGFFNVKFIYNENHNRLYLVEINPKIATQFSDLYEKVDGINSYKTLVNLSLKQKPQLTSNKGIYEAAGSFVLRTFSDYIVKRVPLPSEIERVKQFCPDMRLEIYVKPQTKLSDYRQDGNSFIYAIYNIGAKSSDQLREISKSIKDILNFQFI